MDCTKFHELISLYIDGETGNIQREALEKHIEGCANCKAYLANQLRLKDMIKESYPQSSDIDLSAGIMGRIKTPSAAPKKQSGYKKLSLFVAAVAAVCVLTIAALMSLHADKTTVAGNEKLEEYVIEHVGSGNGDFKGKIEAVNLEK